MGLYHSTREEILPIQNFQEKYDKNLSSDESKFGLCMLYCFLFLQYVLEYKSNFSLSEVPKLLKNKDSSLSNFMSIYSSFITELTNVSSLDNILFEELLTHKFDLEDKINQINVDNNILTELFENTGDESILTKIDDNILKIKKYENLLRNMYFGAKRKLKRKSKRKLNKRTSKRKSKRKLNKRTSKRKSS